MDLYFISSVKKHPLGYSRLFSWIFSSFFGQPTVSWNISSLHLEYGAEYVVDVLGFNLSASISGDVLEF